MGRCVNHLLTVSGVCVLIEVQARAARLVREADDAMAGVGGDPASRRLGGGTWLRPKHGHNNATNGRLAKAHDSSCSPTRMTAVCVFETRAPHMVALARDALMELRYLLSNSHAMEW